MALTDAGIRAIQPSARPFKRADAKGLLLLVTPTGSKLWRLKFRVAGKEKQLALGAYPAVSLGEARKLRDHARLKIDQGIDPCMERKKQKAARKVAAAHSFSAIADEYIGKMEKEKAEATVSKARYFLSHLKPAIGSMPISEVDPQMLLAALKRLESRGNHETAKKTRSFASRVFRYAVATGRASSDPAALLNRALVTHKPQHYPAILDKNRLAHFLEAANGYCSPVTRLALKILPHVFLRPGELRLATWEEVDFDSAVWTIPAGRTKMRRIHFVPLSPTVIELLRETHRLTGPRGYIFPATNTRRKPMSENTMNGALRRMGFTKDEATAHGFRATASTLLNECRQFGADAIERALAHAPASAVRAVYHRSEYWDERVQMAAWWSDFLDGLAGTASAARAA